MLASVSAVHSPKVDGWPVSASMTMPASSAESRPPSGPKNARNQRFSMNGANLVALSLREQLLAHLDLQLVAGEHHARGDLFHVRARTRGELALRRRREARALGLERQRIAA